MADNLREGIADILEGFWEKGSDGGSIEGTIQKIMDAVGQAYGPPF